MKFGPRTLVKSQSFQDQEHLPKTKWNLTELLTFHPRTLVSGKGVRNGIRKLARGQAVS